MRDGGGVGVSENEHSSQDGLQLTPVHMPVLQPAALRSKEIIEKKIYF